MEEKPISMEITRSVRDRLWLVAWRLFQALLTAFAVSIVFFTLTELSPGDFATATATRDTPWETILRTRYELGLYAPAVDRYIQWITGVLQGDFGTSWSTRREIAPLIGERLLHSAWLAGWAILVTVPIGIGLSILAVIWRKGLFDKISAVVSLIAISFPEFVVGYLLMVYFGVHLKLLPVFTVFTDEMSFLMRLKVSALPIMSLAAVTIVPIFRQVRAALINVMSAGYVEMAMLKGVKRSRIVWWHAFPNALGPVATSVLLAIGNLFFGLIVIEIVFNYPGLGHLLLTAVGTQDVPLVLSIALISAALYIALNMLADVVSEIFNPLIGTRVRSSIAVWRAITILRWMRRRWAITALSIFVVAGSAWGGDWLYLRYLYSHGVEVETLPPATNARDRLTVETLFGDEEVAIELVHYSYFKPMGTSGPARHRLSGQLRFSNIELYRRRIGDRFYPGTWRFPDVTLHLVSNGETLLPIERERVLISRDGSWTVVPSPGRVWHEEADGDWSRAAFPFMMVGRLGGAAYYGVVTFIFNDTDISELRVQIAQETGNWAQYNMWGQGRAPFEEMTIQGTDEAWQAFETTRSSRIEMKPWSALTRQVWGSLEAFDGKGNRENISVSALLVDDVGYLRPCRTRAGPFPYCAEMRHSVFSISKTLGAAVSLLWLAERYGPKVLDERITDYVDIPARHDGWRDVTFLDALDMTTGIGNIMPYRVDTYVEADSTPIAGRVWRAPTIQGKLDAMGQFANYPWGPGDVTRYRSSDTTALAAAMEAFLRVKEGANADLWEMVTEEVFVPLGIDRVPVRRSVEKDGRAGTPMLAAGMYLTVGEALKLARLFQDHGEHAGRQLLHRALTARSVSFDLDRGFPTGWRTREGGEGHYEMSFWLTHHVARDGCTIRVPTMAGFGGNYVSIMPNRTIGLRFADGHDDDPHTWDSYGIRSVSERIRSFCD